MENLKQKIFIGLLFIFLFTPYFLFIEVPTKSPTYFTPISLQNGTYFDNSILTSEISPTVNVVEQKISQKFQKLLKTSDLTQKIKCFILLNEQPTNTIARQVRDNPSSQDRVLLRKTIYHETRKKVLPMQNDLVPLISSLDGKILRHYVVINALLVEIPLNALPELAELYQIARIEPDYKLQIQLEYSQPIVTNTTSPGWDYTYNGTGIVVAVCDTGIDKTHPNLVGKVINESSFVLGEPTDDLDGHGTHVAGIIASNDTTYHGIATNVSLVNVKIMDISGTGDTSNLVSGIEWLLLNTSHIADVINLSAGTASVTADGDSVLAKFIDAIVSSYNIVWVNAAGNGGPFPQSIEVPGDALNCISVANFNDADSLNPATWSISSGSSVGPTDDGRKKPDIAAPGTIIWSTIHNWEGANPDFAFKSGTSMASPHVAGAAALILQYLEINHASLDSDWYALTTKGVLLHTAYDLGTSGYDYYYGFGAVDMGSVWNFFQTGNFENETLEPSHGICKYSLNLTTPQIINTTVVWNRYASTDFNYIYFSNLANIDLRLETTGGQLISSSTSNIDNVEHISYNASAGTYYLFVEVMDFKNNEEQEYIILSDTSITFVEKIRTWTALEIITLVCVVGIVATIAISVFLWYRSRKTSPKEETPLDVISTRPEWSPAPEY
ncbi:MAG: S8 family serine peptidase [Candidatus Helarchaeota archaeon]|nr:S8 family serine peptidase [Candidatus Helarchaeota archaeon]